MVVANNEIDETRQIDDDFDGHGDAAVLCGAHRPIEHIQWLRVVPCFSARPGCMTTLGNSN